MLPTADEMMEGRIDRHGYGLIAEALDANGIAASTSRTLLAANGTSLGLFRVKVQAAACVMEPRKGKGG